MIKTLTRTGNNLALVLDRPMLDELGVDAETPLEVSTDGDIILVTPVRDTARREQLDQILETMNSKYADAFKRLAE